jgi:hypothetical protein
MHWLSTAEGRYNVPVTVSNGVSGTDVVCIDTQNGYSGIGAIYFGSQATATSQATGGYSIKGDGVNTTINVPSGGLIGFGINDTVQFSVNNGASGTVLYNATTNAPVWRPASYVAPVDIQTVPIYSLASQGVTGITGMYLAGFFPTFSQVANTATVALPTGTAGSFSVAIYSASGTMIGNGVTGVSTTAGLVTVSAMGATLVAYRPYYVGLSAGSNAVRFAGAIGATGPQLPGFGFTGAPSGAAFMLTNTNKVGQAITGSGCTGTTIAPWIALGS